MKSLGINQNLCRLYRRRQKRTSKHNNEPLMAAEFQFYNSLMARVKAGVTSRRGRERQKAAGWSLKRKKEKNKDQARLDQVTHTKIRAKSLAETARVLGRHQVEMTWYLYRGTDEGTSCRWAEWLHIIVWEYVRTLRHLVEMLWREMLWREMQTGGRKWFSTAVALLKSLMMLVFCIVCQVPRLLFTKRRNARSRLKNDG